MSDNKRNCAPSCRPSRIRNTGLQCCKPVTLWGTHTAHTRHVQQENVAPRARTHGACQRVELPYVHVNRRCQCARASWQPVQQRGRVQPAPGARSLASVYAQNYATTTWSPAGCCMAQGEDGALRSGSHAAELAGAGYPSPRLHKPRTARTEARRGGREKAQPKWKKEQRVWGC